MRKEEQHFKTISSQKDDILDEILESSDSFIPFSNRTSLTHAPTIYEEVIQKYENDIRNHIRIEQQMKLHSDSVINKLEDKEKEYDRMILNMKEHQEVFKKEAERFKIEARIMREENEALKKALEKKIEKCLNVERDLKEANIKISSLQNELDGSRKSLEKNPTPRKSFAQGGIPHHKPKFKSNSANPNSSRKTTSESMQMFYSRNVTVPNNCNEELIIPVSSTRSPQKFAINNGIKSIIMKKDGKSPYLQADMEKLKQYITVPKSKGHKRSKSQTIKSNPPNRKGGARSSIRADRVHTEENNSESFYKIQDYTSTSINNSLAYGVPKKNVTLKKAKIKAGLPKSSHFMSYDVRSS